MRIAYIISLLIITLYYGYFFNGKRFPVSFCAGSQYIIKEGHEKLRLLPHVIGIVLTILISLVMIYISLSSPAKILLSAMALVCVPQFIFQCLTISVPESWKLRKIHNTIGEVSDICLIAWSILASIMWRQFWIPLSVLIIINGLQSIVNKSTRVILLIFWRELTAYLLYFITAGFILQLI